MDAITSSLQVTTSPKSGGSGGTTDAANADFETFLTLLTTQLKNQDPLKPLESTDFVAQLANFSAVEQQVRTNDSLAELKNLFAGNSVQGLSSWIGKEVRSERDAVFNGQPLDIFVSPDKEADAAWLVVNDAKGAEVQRLALPLNQQMFEWAGMRESGDPLAVGTYRLAVESHKGGEILSTNQASIYSEVVEARIEGDATLLMLKDGSVVPSDLVTAMRQSN